MKHIEADMEMHLYDNDEDRTKYTYTVTEDFVVEGDETWVLEDFGDDRLTIVICTDDGTWRQIVVEMLKEYFVEYFLSISQIGWFDVNI